MPQMANKGRLKEGADEGITIFDPKTVRERATYVNPGLTSEGIHSILVNGTLIIDKAKAVASVAPTPLAASSLEETDLSAKHRAPRSRC